MVLGSWLGVDSSTPFDVTPTVTLAPAGSGTGATWAPTSPAITTINPGCAIISGIMFDADPPINVTGMTDAGSLWTSVGLINSTAFGGGFANCAMMRLNTNQAAAGTFAAQLFSVALSTTNAGTWVIWTAALRPAGLALPPFVDVPDLRRVYRFAPSRIPAPVEVLGRLVKPWAPDAVVLVPSKTRKALILPEALPARVLAALPTWAADAPAQSKQPSAPARVSQDAPVPGIATSALGPIVEAPAPAARAVAPRAAPVDQALPQLGTHWAPDAITFRTQPAPVRVLQDTALPAPQVLLTWAPEAAPVRAVPAQRNTWQDLPLPGLAAAAALAWATDGTTSRALPVPARVVQDVPLPALQVLLTWSPEAQASRALPVSRKTWQDVPLPALPALFPWVADVAAARGLGSTRRVAQETVLPGFVTAPPSSWVADVGGTRALPVPRRPGQLVPLPGIAVLAALAWAPEGPTSRALPVPRRAGQDMPLPSIAAVALAWAPEVQPSRARPAQARAVQDTTLPAVRIALPWVPDAVQLRAQVTARAQLANPLVFAPLLADVVIDTQQMRVQSAPRRIEQAADTLPPIAGLLIAWVPDVYYPRQAKGASSYYAGVYVLPGLVATLIRPASGPQHRTAYGVRTRTAQEKPRTRTAYGAPRNRTAR
jgi:hypothetical protein